VGHSHSGGLYPYSDEQGHSAVPHDAGELESSTSYGNEGLTGVPWCGRLIASATRSIASTKLTWIDRMSIRVNETHRVAHADYDAVLERIQRGYSLVGAIASINGI